MSPNKHLDSLTDDEKRALLSKLLHQQGSTQRSAPTAASENDKGLDPASREVKTQTRRPAADYSKWPITIGQQALWTHQDLRSDSAAYNLGFALRFHGSMDMARLLSALRTVAERHDPLRSTFVHSDDGIVRIVQPLDRVALQVHPTSNLSCEDLDRELKRAASQPFCLHDQIPLRCHCFSQSDAQHIVVLTIHHIVADYASILILLEEIHHAYFKSEQSPQEFEPYSGFVDLEREYLASYKAGVDSK